VRPPLASSSLSFFSGLLLTLYRLRRMRFDQFVSPITCWCLGNLSVGINSSIFTTMLLAIFSQFYLRRYRATWFRKYNYLMSAALDGGTQLFVFIAVRPRPPSPRRRSSS